MKPFYENPLQEQQLIFSFPDACGAPRYERWDSHVARIRKKAVDFIYPESESRKLYFTEVKDFMTITKEGKFKKGDYSIPLAENVAQKVQDSFAGFDAVCEENPVEEQHFTQETGTYERNVVFHWEFNAATSVYARKNRMMLMKQKLRQLLNGTCSRIQIENMDYNPSPVWTVTRSVN